jgi:hypothetical protein
VSILESNFGPLHKSEPAHGRQHCAEFQKEQRGVQYLTPSMSRFLPPLVKPRAAVDLVPLCDCLFIDSASLHDPFYAGGAARLSAKLQHPIPADQVRLLLQARILVTSNFLSLVSSMMRNGDSIGCAVLCISSGRKLPMPYLPPAMSPVQGRWLIHSLVQKGFAKLMTIGGCGLYYFERHDLLPLKRKRGGRRRMLYKS